MFDSLLKRLEPIKSTTIMLWINEYMKDNEERILKMAKNRMKRGEGVNGGVIGYYASASYSIFKKEKNPLADGTVDLFLDGDLFKEMRISKILTNYEIYSTDEKYNKLADKYGANQFGLTEEQHNEVINSCMKYVIKKIYEKF